MTEPMREKMFKNAQLTFVQTYAWMCVAKFACVDLCDFNRKECVAYVLVSWRVPVEVECFCLDCCVLAWADEMSLEFR